MANDVKGWADDTYNNAKDWVVDTYNNVKDFVLNSEDLKKAFKTTENNFLKLEAGAGFLSRFISTPNYGNYESNLQNDIKDMIVEDQYAENVSKLKLGNNYSLSYNGCEVIAIYNSKILIGMEDVSLAETINNIEKQHGLICGIFAKGCLGSNPYEIPRMLDAEGVKYGVIGIEDLNNPGIYVVSYWNTMNYGSMLHTVAVVVPENGTPQAINGDFSNISGEKFVTGYEILRK